MYTGRGEAIGGCFGLFKYHNVGSAALLWEVDWLGDLNLVGRTAIMTVTLVKHHDRDTGTVTVVQLF